jgi:hypothetical protein
MAIRKLGKSVVRLQNGVAEEQFLGSPDSRPSRFELAALVRVDCEAGVGCAKTKWREDRYWLSSPVSNYVAVGNRALEVIYLIFTTL